MMLSPHFSLAELTVSETAARAGIDNTPPPEIVERLKRLCIALEAVRVRLGGAPIIVTSGYRSPQVNTLVRGAPSSQHLRGEAADFIVPRFGSPIEVCTALRDSGIEYDQLIYEFGRWVHLSVADKPRHMALAIDRAGTRPMFA